MYVLVCYNAIRYGMVRYSGGRFELAGYLKTELFPGTSLRQKMVT
jgi:hypothetical protein